MSYRQCSVVLCFLLYNLNVVAQPSHDNQFIEIYGKSDQPGYQIQQEIKMRVKAGSVLFNACEQVMKDALTPDSALLDKMTFDVVNQRQNLSFQLIHDIAQVTQLPEAVKMSIEKSPTEAGEIIIVAISLYPESAQEIVNAATLTGHISVENALIAALSAGADPTSVSIATAAGVTADVGAPPNPLGVGVGAGGSGGGDTTASSN